MNTNFYRDQAIIPNNSLNIPSNNYNMYDNYNTKDYVEYYLKDNIGKKVKVYVSFSDSTEWKNSVFIGNLKSTGKDYIVVYDNITKNDYVIWSIYIDYIIFLNNN